MLLRFSRFCLCPHDVWVSEEDRVVHEQSGCVDNVTIVKGALMVAVIVMVIKRVIRLLILILSLHPILRHVMVIGLVLVEKSQGIQPLLMYSSYVSCCIVSFCFCTLYVWLKRCVK